MNDPDRGTVWEESVISCPPSVRILALSATMGNVNDIKGIVNIQYIYKYIYILKSKGWISSIHGPTELILSEHRPVPLRYLFSMRQGLFPLFRDPNAGPGALAGVKKTDGKLDNGVSINPTIIKYEEQFMKNAQSMKMTRSGRPLKGFIN
jgi:superfamily II RNA helicase